MIDLAEDNSEKENERNEKIDSDDVSKVLDQVEPEVQAEEKEIVRKAVFEKKKVPEAEKDKQIDELTEHLQRLQAEFENYKKRSAKDLEHAEERATREFFLRLLEFVDEFEMAMDEIEKSKDKSVARGVELLYNNLVTMLEKNGVVPFETEIWGEIDPGKHDVMYAEESEKPAGRIVRVLKKGYTYKGKILRHAHVSVSKHPEKKEKTEHEHGKDKK
ncbi:Protein GrpE [Candidatus Gugararchaeum adminiculabundum]|nr:Protein GrpE [Candidatus Gugararchaeum adminiculabundum]